jgi:Response regulator receiver domain
MYYTTQTLTGGSYGVQCCGDDEPSGSEFWFSVAYCPVTDTSSSSSSGAAASSASDTPAAAGAGGLTSCSTAALLVSSSSAALSVRSSGASSATTAAAAATAGDAPGSGVLTAANSRASKLLTVRASPALSLAESEATAAAVAALLESPVQHSYHSSSCGSGSGSSVRSKSDAGAHQHADTLGASWHNNPPALPRMQSSSSSAGSGSGSASTGLLLVTVEQQSVPSRPGSRRNSFSNGVFSSSSNAGTPRLRLQDAAAAAAAAAAGSSAMIASDSSSAHQVSPVPNMQQLQVHAVAQQQSPPSVLVVDDEPSIRTFLSRMFVKRGYVVAQAADGLEGLQIMKTQAYDAVLMDLNM